MNYHEHLLFSDTQLTTDGSLIITIFLEMTYQFVFYYKEKFDRVSRSLTSQLNGCRNLRILYAVLVHFLLENLYFRNF